MPNVSEDKSYIAAEPSTRSELAIPLRALDSSIPLGVINLEFAEINAITEDELLWISDFTGPLANYLANAYAGGNGRSEPELESAWPNLANLTPPKRPKADPVGNTYFVALHCVFKLDHDGVVTRIAGNARAGYSGDSGPAITAQLRLENTTPGPPLLPLAAPPGLAVDNTGNVYIADNGNYRIRKISPDGIINTVAGNGTQGFSGDGGPATSAQLSSVSGLAVDIVGNLWISDSGANRIRQDTQLGIITTVAGTGACGFSGEGSPAGAAQLCNPEGIAADSAGDIFVADTGNSRIRRISPGGSIATVAGTGVPDYTETGDCSTLCLPSAVAADPAGNLFVADYDNLAADGA